jgi:hypothetical protein
LHVMSCWCCMRARELLPEHNSCGSPLMCTPNMFALQRLGCVLSGNPMGLARRQDVSCAAILQPAAPRESNQSAQSAQLRNVALFAPCERQQTQRNRHGLVGPRKTSKTLCVPTDRFAALLAKCTCYCLQGSSSHLERLCELAPSNVMRPSGWIHMRNNIAATHMVQCTVHTRCFRWLTYRLHTHMMCMPVLS